MNNFSIFMFIGNGRLTSKINTTFFYHKFDVKYFHVKQFFQKKVVVSGETKQLLWGHI